VQRATATEHQAAARLQRHFRARERVRKLLAAGRRRELRELREQARGTCHHTIASKRVSVYLAQNASKSWYAK